MKDFSSIVAPMTKVLKAKTFEWKEQAHLPFEEIKQKLTTLSSPRCLGGNVMHLELILGLFYPKRNDRLPSLVRS